MDIAALSMAMSTSELKQQSNLALMEKIKGDTEDKGAQIVEMLE